MIRLTRTTRRAFTLVEMLVAMAVLVTLASIALVVVPDVMSQDRTVDAAGSVRQWLTIAKSRAARDKYPRGVRLRYALDPQVNPAKTSPLWVTEVVFTEAIPVLQLTTSQQQFTNVFLLFKCAYDASGNVIMGTIPGSGGTMSPQCVITNLAQSDATQITVGSLITLTTLGTSHRVLNIASGPSPSGAPVNGNQPYSVTLVLDSFPQAQLGAAGSPAATTPAQLQSIYATTLFGITAPPQPLIGEPALPLPTNICVDLGSSQSGSSLLNQVQGDVDIVFLPSGQVMPTWTLTSNGFQAIGATSQMFLWVRDYTKNGGNPANYLTASYPQGGDQQIVALKCKSGSLGVFPVAWSTTSADPFYFARYGATSP